MGALNLFDSELFKPLTNKNGIQTFVGNIEFWRDGVERDESCLVLYRVFMGRQCSFIFPLCDAWTVREPEFFQALMEDAADVLFISPTNTDRHTVGDIILRDLDEIINWFPDDDANYDKQLIKQELERVSLFVQVDGRTVIDSRG